MDQNELISKLSQTYEYARELDEKSKIVEEQIGELEIFSHSVDELKESKGKEILASLGKGVFAKSELKEDKFFVEVGAGIYVKKSLPSIKKTIEEQIKRLEEVRFELRRHMEAVEAEMQQMIAGMEAK